MTFAERLDAARRKRENGDVAALYKRMQRLRRLVLGVVESRKLPQSAYGDAVHALADLIQVEMLLLSELVR